MKRSKASCPVGSLLLMGFVLTLSGCNDEEGIPAGTTQTATNAGGSGGATGGTAGNGGTAGGAGGATGGTGGTTGGAGGGGGGTAGSGGAGGGPLSPPALYVAHEGAFAAYDIATGAQIGTTIANSMRPTAMQVLDDGTVMTNMTNSNDVLVVNGITAEEIARPSCTVMGGTRPVDSNINPDLGGDRYWLLLNDGNAADPATWSAALIDITAGSPTRFQIAGEVPLGNGHHAAAFSATKPRFVASSFNDCDNVFSVFDFTTPAAIDTLLTITAPDLGFDGSTMAKTCDPAASLSLRPHGCATSKANDKVYCNMAGPGMLVVMDVDADPPSFQTLQLSGKGGGYVKAGEGGDFLYTVQASPNEAAGGAPCQIGQLVTIDAMTDTVVDELPLFYKGPGCMDALTGTDEATVGPNHLRLTPDGKTLFVALSTSSMDPLSRHRYMIAVDLSDPMAPVQLPSVPVGESTGQRGSAISGDGQTLYVADSISNTVTAIDTGSLTVVNTYPVMASPLQVATFGGVDGASGQIGPVH